MGSSPRPLVPLLLLPAALAMAAVVFVPLGRGVATSFTDLNQYSLGAPGAPARAQFVGLRNYRTILGSAEFWSVFRQTVVWTIVNVAGHLALGLGLALMLHRPFPGRGVYRVLLLVPWAVPTYISACAWRWLFNDPYGLFNRVLVALGGHGIPWLSQETWAMVAVLLTNIWLGFPFMMVVLLGGLQAIPEELYEAARVDGAGRLQQFRAVTWPGLKPVALMAVLLGAIWTFNMFNVIYLVTQGGPYHTTEILATFAYLQAFDRWEFGLATAYGVIILAILLVFSAAYLRALRGARPGEVA